MVRIEIRGPGWVAVTESADRYGGPKAVANRLRVRGATVQLEGATVVVDATAPVQRRAL